MGATYALAEVPAPESATDRDDPHDTRDGRAGDVPTATEIAAALTVSERTLRRRLVAEGTSVRTLVDEVRATLAAEFLSSGSLTVAEIAERLGYVEVSSFSQAFRRWHGVSARQYVAAAAT